jgi:hypothetical protein
LSAVCCLLSAFCFLLRAACARVLPRILQTMLFIVLMIVDPDQRKYCVRRMHAANKHDCVKQCNRGAVCVKWAGLQTLLQFTVRYI